MSVENAKRMFEKSLSDHLAGFDPAGNHNGYELHYQLIPVYKATPEYAGIKIRALGQNDGFTLALRVKRVNVAHLSEAQQMDLLQKRGVDAAIARIDNGEIRDYEEELLKLD